MKPLRKFLGKSEVCELTRMSGAFDKPTFDGNTILLKISEENDKHRLVYIGGDKICSFLTDDDFYKYVSSIGSITIPYSIAVSNENL